MNHAITTAFLLLIALPGFAQKVKYKDIFGMLGGQTV